MGRSEEREAGDASNQPETAEEERGWDGEAIERTPPVSAEASHTEEP